MAVNAQLGIPAPTLLGNFPCKGGVAIQLTIPFDGTQAEYDVDLSKFQNSGLLDAVQTIYVDNSASGTGVKIVCNGSNHTVYCKANQFAYLPVIAPNPPKFRIIQAAATAVTITLYFINFFIPPFASGV